MEPHRLLARVDTVLVVVVAAAVGPLLLGPRTGEYWVWPTALRDLGGTQEDSSWSWVPWMVGVVTAAVTGLHLRHRLGPPVAVLVAVGLALVHGGWVGSAETPGELLFALGLGHLALGIGIAAGLRACYSVRGRRARSLATAAWSLGTVFTLVLAGRPGPDVFGDWRSALQPDLAPLLLVSIAAVGLLVLGLRERGPARPEPELSARVPRGLVWTLVLGYLGIQLTALLMEPLERVAGEGTWADSAVLVVAAAAEAVLLGCALVAGGARATGPAADEERYGRLVVVAPAVGAFLLPLAQQGPQERPGGPGGLWLMVTVAALLVVVVRVLAADVAPRLLAGAGLVLGGGVALLRLTGTTVSAVDGWRLLLFLLLVGAALAVASALGEAGPSRLALAPVLLLAGGLGLRNVPTVVMLVGSGTGLPPVDLLERGILWYALAGTVLALVLLALSGLGGRGRRGSVPVPPPYVAGGWRPQPPHGRQYSSPWSGQGRWR